MKAEPGANGQWLSEADEGVGALEMFDTLNARDCLTVCGWQDVNVAYTTEEQLAPTLSNQSKHARNREFAFRLPAQKLRSTVPPTLDSTTGWP